jgi:putative salt-induced outer membrane protein YdiY
MTLQRANTNLTTIYRTRFLMLAVSLLLVAGFSPSVALAQEEPKDGPVWEPPKSDKWDWVHLTSGEWLKGEVKTWRDRKILFDSDNLDEQEIDLPDIQTLYLNRLGFIRMESGETAQGTGVLRGDTLIFETVDGKTHEVARTDVVSIVPGGEHELDYWAMKAGASYAYKSGNTDQLDLSGTLSIRRDTASTRFRNDYRGVYGSQDSVKNQNNHRATSLFDIFLTSRFYITVPEIEYYKDQFKNLKHRVTPGGGIGYEFIRNSFMELDVRTGAAYQFTEFENGDTADDFAATAKADLDFDLPGGTELDNSYSLQLIATDLDKTSHHFESILSVDIWGPLDLDLTFMLDRIEQPESDGSETPDKNDFTVLAGFSIDF